MASKAAIRRARFIGVSAERLAQADMRGERLEVVNLHPSGLPHYETVRICGDEVCRLARRGRLEPHMVEAAERLARLHEACRWPDARAVDPARIRVDGGCGGELSDAAAAARQEYARAIRATGPLSWEVVRRVVIEGERLVEVARRLRLANNRQDMATAALWVLKAGLDALAAHWGLRHENRQGFSA